MAKPKKPKTEEPVSFPQRYLVVAADFSLTRPGFSKILVEQKDGQTHILSVTTSCVDNKKTKKKHGEILNDIMLAMKSFFFDNEKDALPAFYVREKAFNSRAAMSEIGIFKVVGIADWVLWQNKASEWHEIYPVTVKKNVTGSGKADKSQVEKALEAYVGAQTYSNDDESDATAVGIGWLIQQEQLKTIELEPHIESEQRSENDGGSNQKAGRSRRTVL